MKKLLIALILMASSAAFAAKTEVWEGPGTLFDDQGKVVSSYHLVVENTKNGREILSHVTVTFPDGTERKSQCRMTETGQKGWVSDCDHGKGGGACFGEGLCESYEEDSTGRAFASTIVMDGSANMRLLRTELKNGRAVHFFREKLQKR